MRKENSSNKIKMGQKYERLTVIKKLFYGKRGAFRVLCRCICGNKVVTIPNRLVSKNTRSCGCLHKEIVSKMMTTHGESSNGKSPTPEYESWCHMIGRCTNHKNKDFKHYGKRGITICERWKKYENFLEDMGRKPTAKHELDRYPDNNGNYEPNNCRWATRKQQMDNRRNTIWLSIGSIKLTLNKWAELSGNDRSCIYFRLSKGWNIERAIFEPSKRKKNAS